MDDPINTALLLYMIDGAAPVFGRTKIQKTPFLVELKLQKSGHVSSTFHYERYKNGPFSQEVWSSLDHLVRHEFVRGTDYGLTDRGLFLLDLVEMLRELNEEVFQLTDLSLRYCKAKTGSVLMHEVYDIKLEPAGRPGTFSSVRDVPMGVNILTPLERTITIPDDLEKIIITELNTSPADLAAGKTRFVQKEREAFSRLLEAIPEGLPS